MSLRRLRKSDIRALCEQLSCDISAKDEVMESEDALLINKEFAFFRHEGIWVPSVKRVLALPDALPQVVVDMGAIRFVTRGADIMRPGITFLPDVAKGTYVQIVDETHKKPLAIGKMEFSGNDAQSLKNGSIVTNLHFVGDELWTTYVS